MAKALSRKVTIYINGKEVENTLKSLRAEVKRLEREQAQLPIGSEEYIKTSMKLAEVKGIIKNQELAIKDLSATTEEARKKAADYGNILMGLKTLWGKGQDLFNWLKGFSDEAARMDDVYADVRKTTGMTKEEVDKLNEAFKQMDTRTAREELNKLAVEAGKLGITGVQAVASFTEAADKIKVALGEDLGEDATTVIGKMADVYTRSTKELSDAGDDLGTKMLRIGSAINSLGAASSAAEPHMVDFMARLGGMASQAGLSAQQVLGYASALDQSGVSVEKSATAFQNFMAKMMQKPAEFAAIARKEVGEFRKMMETDMDAAIKAVLAGLNEEGGMTKLAPLFKDLQLSGQGVTTMLTTLKGSIDKVNEAQAIANVQMSTGASIEEEFAEKNNTMQARLEKAKDTFHDTAETLGNALYPAIISVTNAGSGLMSGASNLIQLLRQQPQLIAPIVAAMSAWAAVKAKTLAITIAEKAAELATLPVKKMRQALDQRQIWLEQKKLEAYHRTRQAEYQEMINKEKLILTDKQYAYTIEGLQRRELAEANIKAYSMNVTQHAEAADKAHTATINAKNAALKATPWGFIITALTTIGTAVYTIWKNSEKVKLQKTMDEVARSAGEAEGKVKVLFGRLRDAKEGSDEYKRALEELKAEYPELIAKHVDEEGKLRDLEAAYKDLAAAARQSVYDRMYADKVSELYGKVSEKLEKSMQSAARIIDGRLKDLSEAERTRIKQDVNALLVGLSDGTKTYREVYDGFTRIMNNASGQNTRWGYLSFISDLDKKVKETDRSIENMKTKLQPTNTDPFKIQGKSVEQLKKEVEETNARIAELNKLQDAAANQGFGATDYSRQILDQQRRVEALTAAIKELESEKKKSIPTVTMGSTVTPDKSTTDSGDKQRARQQEQIDRFLRQSDKTLAALRKKMAGTVDESKLTEAEKAARQLAEQLAEIDEAINGIEIDTENATLEQIQQVEALKKRYRQLRAEVAAAGQAQIEAAKKLDMKKAADEAWQAIQNIIDNLPEEDLRSPFEKWLDDDFGAWCDKNLEIIKKFSTQATSIWGSLNTIMDNIGQRRLNKEKRRYEEQEEELERQLDEGIISQEEYNERKEELDKELDEKEKELALEQWKRNKALRLGEAIIEGAMAVLHALNDKTIESSLARIAMAVVVGAATLAQIAAIASEPAPYAKGGYVDRDTTFYRAGEAGPEWVASNQLLNDRTTAPIIQALEDYQRGDRHALADIPMSRLDVPAAMKASQSIGRGQVVVQQPAAASIWEHPTAAAVGTDSRELVSLMRELVTYEKDPRNRQAVISRQTMKDFDNNENFLRSRARL